ncbi:Transcriptional regulator of competence genes, TfoX/Sxy family [Ruminococcus sp. YRD2003]|uniref:TfoX/Sxy family protein n=1 Tax=Ruminococcus sp. YRD2003 TaxID=1452313 RepID=UPI0008C6931A|nr:Transcriptional regulator of competence genes, TfoX/Sxy family [Ruminococcus flavefaciens]
MATDKGYLEYITEQLSSLDGLSYRAMMGEYIICYKGRIVGGIYDDRLLVKQTAAAERLMPNAPRELPYEGGKPMLLVEDVDDSDFLCRLIEEMYDGLPEPRKRK